MNGRERQAPRQERPCEQGDRPAEDHPQAQAAQCPGGGGAPETGHEGEYPPEEAPAAGRQER
jgi:hypothetical protein